MKRIIGILGWVGIALVVAAVIIKFSRPELGEWQRGLAIAGLVATVLYALSQWRDIGRSFQGRSAQYGSIATGTVVLFLAILVGINWVARRKSVRWDLTESRFFSLSDQTKQIVSRLKAPLSVKVFYDGRSETPQRYRDRLEAYQQLSNQVTAEYIDAVAKPTESEKYEITAAPTLILEYGGRTQRATSVEEQALTNALKKLLEGKAKKAYFTQGHGESDPEDSSPGRGYKGASAQLVDENFEVARITLAQQGSIPADASVVVVAGPTGDFLPQETELLRGFLKNGGKVLLMLDPPAKGGPNQAPSLTALAREWGIQVGDDLVVDPNGQAIGADASVPVGMPAPHAITNAFRRMTAFRLARSVSPVEGGSDGKFAQKVIQTGDQSWSESDVKGLYATMRPEKNLDKGDKAGPIAVVVAVSAPAMAAPAVDPTANAPKPESRLVVVGDSDFASNSSVAFQGNGDFFLNTMNWLAQQEDLIAIRPKDPEDRRVDMTIGSVVGIRWFTIGVVPLLLFGNAIRVYRKRR